jgi:hypothetical protein
MNRAHGVLLVSLAETILGSVLTKIVRVKAHVLRIRVPFNLHVRGNIFQFKFTFAAVRACSFVRLNCSLSFHQFIGTEVAHIVETALASEHAVEIPETHWAVIFELIPMLPVLREKIAALNVFQLVFSLDHDIRNLPRLLNWYFTLLCDRLLVLQLSIKTASSFELMVL